jgi:hypothetical protein
MAQITLNSTGVASSGSLLLQSNGTTTAVTIDTSQNVGVGVTPTGKAKLEVYTGVGDFAGISTRFNATNLPISFGVTNSNGVPYLGVNTRQVSGTDGQTYDINGFASRMWCNGGGFSFFTAASGTAGNTISFAQAMTLDASGNLLLGVTSGTRRLNITYAAASGGIYLETSNADSTFLSCIRSATVNVQHKIIGSTYQIVNDSAGVSLAAGGTSWGSLSDERKKDIIEPITNATNKLSTLRAVIGKYKTEEDGIRRAMLIAQDVQAVLPEAVVENKDGDLILQYTDTIPLLVAAIKEQQAIIQTLTDRITALEQA